MQEVFTVFQGSEPFGTAEIIREGLYYRIWVQCPEPARILISGCTGNRDLGICVPEAAGGFVLRTRIPVRQMGEERISFLVIPEGSRFCPISPEDPFFYLDKIRSSILVVRNSQIGLQTEISSPTGQ